MALVLVGCALAFAASSLLYATGRIDGYRAGGTIGLIVIALVALKVVALI